MPYFYIDPMYLILVLPAMLFSLWASAHVNSTFKRYQKVYNSRGMTGADAAQAVLHANGVYNVRIERISGNLTDHYDPRTNVIRLSDSVYGMSTAAAVGVAAHEAGHAVQYATNYAPIKLRAAIINATNIGSKLSVPMILLGLFLMSMGEIFYWIAIAGVLLFGLSVVFQLLTLPVEFNASRRAIETIRSTNLLTDDERKGARKVLSAAAMTYVAALAVTLAQFLRLLLMVMGRSGRRRR